MNNIRRLKWQVDYCLKEYPKTRNSDILLRQEIIRYFHPSKIRKYKDQECILLKDEFDLPTQEAVKRVRAVLQNVEGKYLPTSWEVARKRGIEREVWEEALGYRLDAETRRRHYETVAENKPPHHIEEELKATTVTYKAEYLGRYGGEKLKTGEIYEITMERMRVGSPIIVVAPVGQTFRDSAAFAKNWRITQ